MAQWTNTPIKDFMGMSTKRNPPLNAFANIQGLDLRSKQGDFVSPPLIEDYFDDNHVPSESTFTGSFLGFTSQFFSQFTDVNHPNGAEAIFYLMKGTVTPLAGSCAWDKKMVGIFMRPYWDGTSWIDSWLWLNRVTISTISSGGSGSANYKFTLVGSIFDGSYPRSIPIYNVTKSQWDICSDHYDDFGSEVFICHRTTWSIGDVCIIMPNYYPTDSLSSIYNSVNDDVCYHRIVDDLRIGFGGKINNLGMGIGYREKIFNISGVSIALDNPILDPYNAISETGTFVFDNVTGGGVNTVWKPSIFYKEANPDSSDLFPDAAGLSLHISVTAVLDDAQEFVITQTSQSIAYAGERSLICMPKIRFATMNKRVTSIRIYVATSQAGGTEINGDYFLCKELTVASAAGGTDWIFDSDGYLILNSNVIDGFTGGGDPTYTNNAFGVGYSDYLAGYNAGKKLTSVLGYTPTTEYVRDWKQAITTTGYVYALSPYVDQSYKNLIMLSTISGDGACCYDVIPSSVRINLENRDGDDVVGFEILPNKKFIVGRNTKIQVADPNTNLVETVYSKGGLLSRKAMIAFGDQGVAFASQFDAFVYGYSRLDNVTEDITDEYRDLVNATGASIMMIFDPYGGAFRMIDRNDTLTQEYIYTPGKGFVTVYSRLPANYLVKDYHVDREGNVLKAAGISSVQIYKLNSKDYDNGVFTLTTEPIDIALINSMSEDSRGLLRSFWIEYSSPTSFTLSVDIDGSSTLLSARTIPATTQDKIEFFPIRFPVLNFKTLQFTISGTIDNYDDNTPPNRLWQFRIAAVGLEWKPVKAGLHG